MPLLNYTTAKPAQETLADIQEILAKWGVQGVLTEFEGRQVAAVSFRMQVGETPMAFKLPCNWRQVHSALQAHNAKRGYRRSSHGGKYKEKRIDDSEEQAIRVAWRIIKDWIEAQMALIEVNMATVPQVFLPYAVTKDGRTLAEKVLDNPGFLLGDGG